MDTKKCEGCHYWFGKFVGNDFLVCAIHPSGWENGECPDKRIVPKPKIGGYKFFDPKILEGLVVRLRGISSASKMLSRSDEMNPEYFPRGDIARDSSERNAETRSRPEAVVEIPVRFGDITVTGTVENGRLSLNLDESQREAFANYLEGNIELRVIPEPSDTILLN